MFRFLNYHKHPQVKGHWVFYFKDPAAGEEFERLIQRKGLTFKKFKEEGNQDVLYFSFPAADFDAAQILNNEALSKSPRSFIPDKGARIFLMVIFVVFVGLALISYLVQKFS